MHKKFCISKSIGVVAVIVVVTFISLLLSSSLLKTKTSTSSRASESKIVGGTEVIDDKKWPFMASIFLDANSSNIPTSPSLNSVCGGILIAPQWILTSGHCLINHFPAQETKSTTMKVFIGSADLRKGDKNNSYSNKQYIYDIDPIIKASNIENWVYPTYADYDPIYTYNNIALLKLKRSVPSSIASPVKLLSGEFNYIEGEKVVMLGWGISDRTTSYLQQGVLPLLDINRVYKWEKSYKKDIDSSQFASGYPNNWIQACAGDAGGPMLVWRNQQWVLVGVGAWTTMNEDASKGSMCHGYRKPRVSNSISFSGKSRGKYINYIDWILNKVGSLPDIYFIGSSLSQGDLAIYNSKVCDIAEWAPEKIPQICNLRSGGKNETLH